jgi:hypothetical protein
MHTDQSRDISVGIATGYGLDRRGSITDREKRFFLFFTVSALALRPTQSRNQWVPLSSFPGGNAADHSSSSSTEVKNGGAIPPLLHTSLWRGA